MDKYMMIYDDGKIKMLVATDMTYEELVELKLRQTSTECYKIYQLEMKT